MPVRLCIAAVTPRDTARGKKNSLGQSLQSYSTRLASYGEVEFPVYESESTLLASLDRQKGRTAPLLVLLDSRGKSFASEDFAALLQRERDGGRQSFIFAIGPASGWSPEGRSRADFLLSLGPMTLPHELARLVLTEQVYRAFTINAGHPYHLGH